MIHLKSNRLYVRQGTETDIAAIVVFLKRNKDFHAPFDPLRPAEYYTKTFWNKHIEIAEKDLIVERYLELFISRKG